MTDEEIEAMVEMMLGLPKVIPKNQLSTIKNIGLNEDGSKMSPEQTQARVDRLIAAHFGFAKEFTPEITSDAKLPKPSLTPEPERPLLTCEEFDVAVNLMLVKDFGPPKVRQGKKSLAIHFTPHGNLTGAPIYEGQSVEVVFCDQRIVGEIACILTYGNAFILWEERLRKLFWEDCGIFHFFFINEVTINNAPEPRWKSLDGAFVSNGNLTERPLCEGITVKVSAENGIFIGMISYVTSDGESFFIDTDDGELSFHMFMVTVESPNEYSENSICECAASNFLKSESSNVHDSTEKIGFEDNDYRSPLQRGQRVEFDAHDKTAAGTGKVRIANEKLVSVYPDSNPSEAVSFPVGKVRGISFPHKNF